MKEQSTAHITLRRSLAPYTATFVIFIAVTLGSLLLLKGKYNASFFMGLLLIWALFIFSVFIGMYYRVSLFDGVLIQRAWMMKKVEIHIEDVNEVKLESGLSRVGTVSRPYNRVAFYGNGVGKERKFIDVSLKHFSHSDIAALLTRVKADRPDIIFSGRLAEKFGIP